MDNDWVSDLETCGWFDDLPEAEVPALKEKLVSCTREDSYKHLATLVIKNPDQIGGPSRLMGSDDFGAIESYEDLIKAYAASSMGAFTPEAMVEEVNDEQGHFAIGFLFSGQIYALFSPGQSQFDLEINDLVNEALAASGSERRFFVLPSPGDEVALAYISPEIFEHACQMGLIPLDEELIPDLYGDFLGDSEPAGISEPQDKEPELELDFERSCAPEDAEFLSA